MATDEVGSDATETGNLFPAIPRAWGFPATTVAELSRQLVAAGPGATLSVNAYRKGDLLYVSLRVIPKDAARAAEFTTLNEAFPCPPFTGCGGGG